MISRSDFANNAEMLVAAGKHSEGLALLLDGCSRSDPEAAYLLATWRLSGHIIKRDLAVARALFAKAAMNGHREAERIHRNFMGNGTGGPQDWAQALDSLRSNVQNDPGAAEQLMLIERMELDSTGTSGVNYPASVISKRPRLFHFPSLFSKDECSFLIGEAKPWVQPSVVIDRTSGRLVKNQIRTSYGAMFPFADECPLIHALNRRIADASGTNVRQGEPLQVLRYEGDQEFRPHLDAIAGEENHRTATMLVYLNVDYTAGETHFVNAGLKFRGEVGDALLFYNHLPDGSIDEASQHAGLPVGSGVKWIASRWIRKSDFIVTPPHPIIAG